jgi:rieske iron-sulfur protein
MVNESTAPHPPSPKEAPSAERRGFLRGLIWAAVAGVTASVLAVVKVVIPQKSGGYQPTVKAGDVLIYAQGGKKGKLIRLDELQIGDSFLAYPQGKESNYANIIRVIREKPGLFQPPTRIDWTDQGVVAYSAICTHLSCTVAWEKTPKVEASIILCHCHNGLYDPLRGAKVIGGPPPRPLPQIAVKIGQDGSVKIMSKFSGPVGPPL